MPRHALTPEREHAAGARVAIDAWVVAILAPLPFLPTLWSGLVADDFFFAALLREVTTPFTAYVLPALLRMQDVPTTFYRPLAFVTLFGETRAWAGDPWPMHLTNLGLHAATAAGVWWLVSALASGRAARAAAVVAPLQWAWFPRRVEPVAWLSCRPDLLATTFAVWGLVAWVCGQRRAITWLRVIGVVLWAAALASKESVAALPLALLVLHRRVAPAAPAAESITPAADTTPSRLRRVAARAAGLWPFGVALLVFFVLRRLALGTWIGGYGASVLSPSLTTAVKHLVYPTVPPLEFLNRALQDRTLAAVTMAVFGGVALVLWAAIARSGRQPLVRLGAAWAVAGALPVATLLPSLTSTMNDRLMYLSGIGFAMMIGGWLSNAGRRVLAVVGVAVCALALQTLAFAEAWRVAGSATARLVSEIAAFARQAPDDVPVFVAAAPDSYRGGYMLRNGLDFALRRLDVEAASRVIVLSHYLIEDPAVMPVDVRLEESGETLHISGRQGRVEVMVGTPGLERWAGVWVSGMDDRFGRHREVRLRLKRRGVVLIAAPGGVERMGFAGPGGDSAGAGARMAQ